MLDSRLRFCSRIVLLTLLAMSLIRNEQIKLTATWANTLADALITAGTFAPIAAFAYGLSAVPISASRMLLLALACFALGIDIHTAARASLGRLRE
jgi:hypothetical protein